MLRKKPSPNFHGETDIAPVPEMPTVSAEDLGQEFNPATPPKNKLMLFIAVGAAVVVILLGGVVFANYQGYLDISFLPSIKDQVVDDMIVAMQSVQKAKYSASVSVVAEPWDGVHQPHEMPDSTASGGGIDSQAFASAVQNIQLQMNVESYFDATTESLKEKDGYIKIDGIYGDPSMQMGINLELRKVGEEIYAQINDYPVIADMFVPQLADLKGKWIEITSESEYSEVLDQIYDNADSIPITQNSNYNLAFDTNFVRLGKKMSSEVIDSQSTMHYKLVIDMSNFDKMYTQAMAELMQSQSELSNVSMEGLENFNLLKLQDSIDTELIKSYEQIIKNTDIQVWIGENDNILRRVKGTIIYVLPEEQRTPEVGQFKFDIVVDLSNINQAMQISEPQSDMGLNDVIELFVPTDPELDTDEDGLTDSEETTYGTEIDNPDTDGDGYKDGEEVDNGYNPAGEGRLDQEEMIFTYDIEADCEKARTGTYTAGEWIESENHCFCSEGYTINPIDGQLKTYCIKGYEKQELIFYDPNESEEPNNYTPEYFCELNWMGDYTAGEWIESENHCLCPDGSTIEPVEDKLPSYCATE